MARFRLQVLAPGRRCVGKNADGSKRYFNFTPEYIREQVARNTDLLKSGIPVPVSWEHRDDALPGRLSVDDIRSRRTKGVAGWAESYDLDGENRAWANVEIPDPADGKQAEKVRFCSPEINDFTDSNGRDWGKIFTHIALTPRPVLHDQPPITRLSHGMRLSVDSEKGTDMGDEPKADEPKGDDKAPDETPPDDKKPDEKVDEGGVKALCAALRDSGLNIPDEVRDLAGLIIAIKASSKDTDMDQNDGLVESPQATSGMALSLEKQTKIAEGMARRNAADSLEALKRNHQITPAIYGDLKKRLGTMRLSFTDSGDVASNDVLAEIAAYAKLPKDHVRIDAREGVRLSNVREVDPLANDAPDESREARLARMKAWDAMNGASR